MKTYSIVFIKSNDKNDYIVNYHKYMKLEDIDWDKVEEYCIDKNFVGYGYQYCKNSNEYHPKSMNILKKYELDLLVK